MAAAIRRLIKDLRNIEEDPPFNVMIDPVSEANIFHWHGVIIGPLDTPYENGIFHFQVEFPDQYPFEPPKIQLLTKIFHPNVFPNGFICMDILKDNWAASYMISDVLLSFLLLLSTPNPDDPGNPEAAHYYRSDRDKYQQITHQWTKEYAIDPLIEEIINTSKQAIIQELNDLETNLASDINIRPLDMRNLFYWQGTIAGPDDSPYQNRIFTINIRYPLNYPEKRPSISFRSYIYHPNISNKTLLIGDEVFKRKWTSNITIRKILQDLFTLLRNPNPDDSSNEDAASLYRKDRQKYNRMAREATNKNYLMEQTEDTDN